MRRSTRMLLATGLGAALVAGCVPPPKPLPPVAKPAIEEPASTGPLTKVGLIHTRLPQSSELPGLVGNVQRHRVAAGEDLLTIARDGGLGFRELRDANPRIDEWEPRPGTSILVPSRFIVPHTSYRGLVINIPEMRLYKFPLDAQPGEEVSILTWPVGLGAEEVPSPIGEFEVKSKDTNPTWVVPDSIYRTMEKPRHVVPPGPDNPLGDYRIRLNVDLYAIHGTNDPWTVGRLTTHGCIRLYPEDIATLYPMVDRGYPGALVYMPVKLGEADGRVYVEVHQDVYQKYPDLERHAFDEVSRAGLSARVDPERLRAAVKAKTGVPTDVSPGDAAVADDAPATVAPAAAHAPAARPLSASAKD